VIMKPQFRGGHGLQHHRKKNDVIS
jgi:hypothetical protein